MQAPADFYKQSDEELAELEQEPVLEDGMEVDGSDSAAPRGKCGLRKAEPFSKRTGGGMFAFCACGMMFPPMELPDCESTRMVLMYTLDLYKDRPNFLHGNNSYTYIAFDDMCHLRRMIDSKKALHPRLQDFMEQVRPVVDFFHFKSHTGEYCHTHTNPHKHKELKGEANLSICEQRFKYIARHKRSFRYMNQARFNFMLVMLAWLDHKARRNGFL